MCVYMYSIRFLNDVAMSCVFGVIRRTMHSHRQRYTMMKAVCMGLCNMWVEFHDQTRGTRDFLPPRDMISLSPRKSEFVTFHTQQTVRPSSRDRNNISFVTQLRTA